MLEILGIGYFCVSLTGFVDITCFKLYALNRLRKETDDMTFMPASALAMETSIDLATSFIPFTNVKRIWNTLKHKDNLYQNFKDFYTSDRSQISYAELFNPDALKSYPRLEKPIEPREKEEIELMSKESPKKPDYSSLSTEEKIAYLQVQRQTLIDYSDGILDIDPSELSIVDEKETNIDEDDKKQTL